MALNLQVPQVQILNTMSKQVVIVKGEKKIFDSLEDASAALGISVASISRACSYGSKCQGWRIRRGPRVFVIRKEGEWCWFVAVRDSRNRGYVKMGTREIVKDRQVAGLKEISEEWYFGTELAGEGGLAESGEVAGIV